jgi:hypothetical protein
MTKQNIEEKCICALIRVPQNIIIYIRGTVEHSKMTSLDDILYYMTIITLHSPQQSAV